MKKVLFIFIALIFAIFVYDVHIARGLDAGDARNKCEETAERVKVSQFDTVMGGNIEGVPLHGIIGSATIDPTAVALVTYDKEGAICPVGSLYRLVSSSICIVQSVVLTGMFKVYCSVLEYWVPIIQILIVLYFMFYCMALMFGIGDAGKKDGRDVIVRIIKISVIFALATDADQFYFWIYEAFIGTLGSFDVVLKELYQDSTMADWEFYTAAAPLSNGSAPPTAPLRTLAFGDDGSIFFLIDRILYMVVSGEGTDFAPPALLFAFAVFWVPVVGPMISFALVTSVVSMILTFFRLAMQYLMAIIILAAMMMFFSIFLSFLIFDVEAIKNMWQRYIGNMLSYTLQPTLLLIFLYVMMHVSSWDMLFASMQHNFHPSFDIEDCTYSWKFFGAKVFDMSITCITQNALAVDMDAALWSVLGITLMWLMVNVFMYQSLGTIIELCQKLGGYLGARSATVTGGASATDERLAAYERGGSEGLGGTDKDDVFGRPHSGMGNPYGMLDSVFKRLELTLLQLIPRRGSKIDRYINRDKIT